MGRVDECLQSDKTRSAVPSTGQSTDAPEVKLSRAVTPRALAIGTLLIIAIDFWNIHTETVARASRVNITQFPVSFVAFFALIVLVVNPVLTALRRKWALTSGEMLVVLGMGLIGSLIPSYGLTSILIGMLATPFYHASPENQWDIYFLDHIPLWLAPRNTGFALTYLFEGLPPGASIPWGVWVVPLFWWGTLIAAVVAFSLGIAVILRRQWAEHERLIYPLLKPAIALTEQPHPGTFWANIVLTRLFWAGFALALGISAWNYLSSAHLGIFSMVPPPPRILWPGQWFYLDRYMPPVWTVFNLYTFGFGYFVDQDILLSFWVFNLLLTAEVGLFRRVGYQIGGDTGILGYIGGSSLWGNAETAWQCFGALVFLVLGGLYVARRHLADVVRKALRPSHPLDDAGEMLSCRTAVLCVIGGLAYTLFWFHAAGLEYQMLIPYLFALLITYIGVTRFVAEGGVLYAFTPMSPQEFMVRINGTASTTASSMTFLTFSFILCSNRKGFLLPPLAQVTRLGGLLRGPGRRLFVAVALAILVAFIVSILMTLYMSYTYGASNFRDYPLTRYPPSLFDRTLTLVKSYAETDPEHFMFLGIGAGVMALLTYLRYRFPWWPLHPIGLPIAGTEARTSIVSIIVVWGIKSVLLWAGGVVLYRRAIPFFVGLIAGYSIAALLGHLADQIWFSGQGHYIHGW